MPVLSAVERPAKATHLREGETPACPKGHGKLYPADGAWHCWDCEAPGEEVAPVALCVPEATNHRVEAIAPEPAAPAEEMLTVDEAAAMLGESKSAIWWRLTKKQLPRSGKRGNAVLICRSAVEGLQTARHSPDFRRQPRRSAEKARALDAQTLGVAVAEPALAPSLADLLEAHTAATSRYLSLHADWQAAAARERELRDQVAEAEAAQREASERLGEGLAALRGPAAHGKRRVAHGIHPRQD